jgi:hypothetical protein
MFGKLYMLAQYSQVMAMSMGELADCAAIFHVSSAAMFFQQKRRCTPGNPSAASTWHQTGRL